MSREGVRLNSANRTEERPNRVHPRGPQPSLPHRNSPYGSGTHLWTRFLLGTPAGTVGLYACSDHARAICPYLMLHAGRRGFKRGSSQEISS
jgi:hypothetical protein